MVRFVFVLCVFTACLSLCFADDVAPAPASPPTTVSGKVLDPDGKPVAGAQVLARVSGGGPDVQTLTTDKDGVFSVDTKELRNRQAMIGQVNVRAEGLGLCSQVLKLNTAENVITLTKARQLAGTVVDEAGKPVEGVALSMRALYVDEKGGGYGTLPPWRNDYIAVTDAQGRWTMNGLPNIGSVEINIYDPRYVQTIGRFKLTPGEPEPQIIVKVGGELTSHLLGLDGKPAAYIDIVLIPVGGYRVIVPGEKTDTDGTFHFRNVPSGKYYLRVSGSLANGLLDYAEYSVTAKQITTVPDIKLQPGTIIDGSVLEAETGEPTSKVWLVFQGPDGKSDNANDDRLWTDAQGHFRVRLTPGKHLVQITQPNRSQNDQKPIEFDAVGTTQMLMLHIQNGITLKGTMVDEQDKPVSGIRVILDYTRAPSAILVADTTGVFTLNGLQKGQVTLRIEENNNTPNEWELVQPKELELPATGLVKIVLKHTPLTTLTGRVLTPAGKPVEGAKVTLFLRLQYWDRTSEVTTDADGCYALEKVKPSTEGYVKKIEKAGYILSKAGKLQRKDNDVTVSDTEMIPLTGIVSGRVVNEADKPVRGARVIAPESGIGNEAVTDAAGHFTLQGLPEGTVCLFAAQERSAGKAQTATNGKPVTITLKQAPAPATFDAQHAEELMDNLCEYLKGAGIDVQFNTLLGVAGRDTGLAERMANSLGIMKDFMILWFANEGLKNDTARALEWGVPHITQTHDAGVKAGLLVSLGIAAIPTDHDLAVELYRQLKELGTDNTPQAQAYYHIQLLRFASRLRNGEAEQQYDIAMKYLPQVPDPSGLYGELAIATAASNPAHAEKALAQAEDRFRGLTFDRMLVEVAGSDQATGLTMLEKRLTDLNMRGYSWTLELFTAVDTLAKRDAKAVLALVNKIDVPAYKSRLLMIVASNLPAAEAKQVYQDAIAAVQTSNSPKARQLVQLAAHLYETDHNAGKKLFATAWELMQNNEDEWYAGITAYAYYYSRVDPAESRLSLESLSAQAIKNLDGSGRLLSLAYEFPLAMAPLDAERALAMAREYIVQYNNFFSMLRDVDGYLLATTEERKWGFFRCEKE